MGKYIKKCPKEPSFSQKGLNGYSYSINNTSISIDIEDVYKGHEKYCKSLVSTFIYYVISGNGTFKIDNEKHEVSEGDVIEIPKDTEFVFAGKMKLLLIMTPPFDPKNEIEGPDNDLY